jgi:N utilization substance protein B
MAIIDRLILRMAVWELSHEPETPAAVVLDEAVELARTFGTDESTSFVNGVLDAVRRTLAGLGPRIR